MTNKTKTILEALFDAISKGNKKDIQRLSKEPLLLKQLGTPKLPDDKDLEYFVVNKLLHNAIDAGDASKVKKLLATKFFSKERRHKVNVEVIDHAQTTPLMHAVQTGNLNMVNILVKGGVDVNAQNTGGATALILASQFGQNDIAKFLIENGAIIGLADKQGKNALMWAAQSNQAELVRSLMDRDANPFNVDNNEMTPIKYAARNSAKEAIGVILLGIKQSFGSNIMRNQATEALFFACGEGNSEIAKLLVKSGADIHHSFGDGATILSEAVGSGNLELVNFLLANGAKPYAEDLEVALLNPKADSKTRSEMFTALVEHGADPLVEERGSKAFMPFCGSIATRAAQFHDPVALEILLKRFPFDPNEGKERSVDMLHLTCVNYSERLGKTISILLENGADPFRKSISGQSAFEMVLDNYPKEHSDKQRYMKEAIKVFVDFAKEKGFESSLIMDGAKMAISNGRADVLEVIIDSGLDVSQKDRDGVTLLKIASKKGDKAIMECLTKRGLRAATSRKKIKGPKAVSERGASPNRYFT